MYVGSCSAKADRCGGNAGSARLGQNLPLDDTDDQMACAFRARWVGGRHHKNRCGASCGADFGLWRPLSTLARRPTASRRIVHVDPSLPFLVLFFVWPQFNRLQTLVLSTPNVCAPAGGTPPADLETFASIAVRLDPVETRGGHEKPLKGSFISMARIANPCCAISTLSASRVACRAPC
jgi:hypothetical protein